jgi:hypothetical protein
MAAAAVVALLVEVAVGWPEPVEGRVERRMLGEADELVVGVMGEGQEACESGRLQRDGGLLRGQGRPCVRSGETGRHMREVSQHRESMAIRVIREERETEQAVQGDDDGV